MQYLLEAVNAFFETDFGPGDLAGAYAGVRPLISSADPKKSVDISRRAELYETSSGMVTITGGKLTTWRRMAKMVVDRIVEREFREAPCRTHEIPLGHPVEVSELADMPEVGERSREHLAGRYGLFAESVLKICAADPGLTRPIVEGMPDLLAEVVVAARHEQARTVADVLLRRTRLGLLAGRRLVEDRDAVGQSGQGDGRGAGLGEARDTPRGRCVARDGRRRAARQRRARPRLAPALPSAQGTKTPWTKNSLLSAAVSASESAPPSNTRT